MVDNGMRPLSEGSKSVQIAIRLAPDEVEGVQRAVNTANKQAVDMGLPAMVTVSSLVRAWIQQQLDAPDDNQTRQLRAAPHLNKASALLRGTRRP